MVPNTNISVTAVKNELKVSDNKVGDLCTSPNINMWSRKKPVKIKGLVNRSGNWWKGDSGTCGFEVYSTHSYRDLPSIYTASPGLNGWKYHPVTKSDPCRLADFMGYDHNAIPPISNFVASSTTVTASGGITFSTIFGGGTNSLTIGDIANLGDYYFGVFVYGTRDMGAIATAESPFTTGTPGVAQQCYVSLTSLPVGNYTAYPFLCDHKIVQGDPEQVGEYVTIPGVSRILIKKVDSLLSVTFSGDISSDKKCNITVSVRNLSSSAFSITDGTVFFRYPSNDYNDPQQIGESKMVLLPKTVASGTTYTYNTVTADVTQIINEVGKVRVWVKLNKNTVSAGWQDFDMYGGGSSIVP